MSVLAWTFKCVAHVYPVLFLGRILSVYLKTRRFGVAIDLAYG